ncbi:ComEA family DNA-binding protein [Thermoflexibacter ruber]|uniref:Competence protein ComEA helix-hairpin-helix repeat region n=1 Tax=Thermoflexibacter ruber TaxID=1003 RepID=A0A1I2CA22_9BACT|nr:helix-hairpin-helix domain-containing protein [Thermoflexibacter ruber]SFE65176.1 competence protein ComEA helix-hairpin-helix repeat region [Thermoflexibacter ruber]
MKKLIFLLRDHFGFSQIETRGFIMLITFMLALLLTPLLLKSFFSQSKYTQEDYQKDLATLNEAIKEFELANHQQDTATHKEEHNSSNFLAEIESKPEIQPFAFNPNELNTVQWKSLGLKPYLAERIIKYRSKGGSFKVKSDLMKIYGFPKELYQRLYSYIQLPENQEKIMIEKEYKQEISEINISSEKIENKPNFKEKSVIQPFDINTADTAQLKQIKGIGAVLSERIVKFRDNLGGFYSIEQVKEVYGLKEEVYQELAKYAKTSKGFELKHININTADVNTLKSHPYIGYKNAQIIVNYRQQHGKFANAEDLLKTKSIDEIQLNKLKMYLTF